MKVLITGGSGLLGWHLTRSLAQAGYTVVSTYYSTWPSFDVEVELQRLDVASPIQVSTLIREARPDVIIHSAAYTDVDGCEVNRKKALQANYYGTLYVSRAARGIASKLVYISTDYVFDGGKGHYREDDEPNPVNYYGLTKLLGEAASLTNQHSLIIRISGLYGYSPTGKKNFAVKAAEALLSGRKVRAFYDQYLSPTYVGELAGLITRALDLDVEGLLHLAGERLSRYQQALLIAEALGVSRRLVEPVSMEDLSLPARRPRDSSLDTSKAQSLGLIHRPHEEAIKDFISRYLEARGLS